MGAVLWLARAPRPPVGLPVQAAVLLGHGPKPQGMGAEGRRADTPSVHVRSSRAHDKVLED